jgi:hypothetical protein
LRRPVRVVGGRAKLAAAGKSWRRLGRDGGRAELTAASQSWRRPGIVGGGRAELAAAGQS